MSEEQSDRRQDILEAAFTEFAAKGYKGATIKSIGRAAKLSSPSLIYWYFPTKEELFQATIESRLPLLKALVDQESILESPPDRILTRLASQHMESVAQPEVLNLARLLLSEMSQRPELGDMVSRHLMEPVLAFLKRYMARQIELGRMRPHDVRSSARAFVGMMLPQMFSLFLVPRLQQDGLSNEEHLSTSISIFLEGLRPQQSDTS